MHTRSWVLITLLAVVLGACSSGQRALRRGHYDKAVEQAIKRLRADPDHTRASQVLRRAFPLALNTHRQNVERHRNSGRPLRWESVLREYQALDYLRAELQRCPACLQLLDDIPAFDAPMREARQKAAEQRYELAMIALRDKEIRARAREAHRHLQVAQELIPGFRDTRDLLQEAHYYATLHVVVEPLMAPVPAMQLDQEFFFNQVMSFLHHQDFSPYVRFYSEGEAAALQPPRIDHRIRLRFERFNLGNIATERETKDVQRDSVLLNPGSPEPVYGPVTARLIVHRKAVTGVGTLDLQIMDVAGGKVILQDKFPGEFTWRTQWATYQGDERALSAEQKEQVKRLELPLPAPQYLFEQFAAPIYDRLRVSLADYYAQY